MAYKKTKSNYCIFILKDFVIKMSEKKGRVPMTDKDTTAKSKSMVGLEKVHLWLLVVK